jgi:molecular chaperone DnaK
VETLGGVMTTMIERNTTIPTKKQETFSTAVDGQTNVEIHVLQGEREFAKDNKSLGTFRLDGIPPAPRGVPQIEVTFDIDANGILNVTAKDKGSGKEQSISITGASTLPEEEVERMVDEAEKNAEEDKKRREQIERKNQADSLVYQAEKQINELGDKIPEEEKSKAENLVSQLKEAVSQEDDEQIQKLMPELQQVLYSIGSNVYQQEDGSAAAAGAAGDGASAGSESSASSSSGKSSGGDDVIDAEFSESESK